MSTYVTIDPGKKGGLVVVQTGQGEFRKNGMIVDCRKMINDYAALHAFFKEVYMRYNRPPFGPVFGIIEEVHSMPKQGVVSAFTFGQGYGALLMGMVATDIPVYQVTPQRWMKDLGLRRPKKMEKTEWKKMLCHIAKQRFRDQDPTLETADALLIAAWVIEKEQLGEKPWLPS